MPRRSTPLSRRPRAGAVLLLAAGWLMSIPVPVLQAQTVNLVPNPDFSGAGGLRFGASGVVPDYWRAFAVGGGAADVGVSQLAGDALFPGSPATGAVTFKVSVFGTDQGFDHDNTRFAMLPGQAYQMTFFVRSGNADGSGQRYAFSFPLFDHHGYLGREPGGRTGQLATAAWTRVVGPLFADPQATFGHVAFRVLGDGGEDCLQIALPSVEGPPDRFVPPSPGAVAQRPTWSSQDKLIGTSYFYWYRWPDQHFFDDGQQQDDALTDHFPEPETVSMESKAWHKKQAADAIEAGIDMLWPVYWAAPGNFDHPAYRLYVTGLGPLQAALDELEAEGKPPLRLGMFYDTTTLLNDVRGAQPAGSGADLTTPEGKDIFYRTIRSFFCTVHPRHWACINGRPIVILYAAGFAGNYDQSSFTYVNEKFAAEFGGVTPYMIRERSWQVTADSDYRWGASLHGPFLDGIAAVGPGYDDRAVPGRWTPIRMRENGDYYRWSWLQVLKSPRRIVHIETWSEMHEGTDICESVEYGRQYINLTRHYASHFKAGTVPDEQVTLDYPQPVDRPPDMTDGAEYADVRTVRLAAQAGQLLRQGIDPRNQPDGTLSLVDHTGGTYLRTDEGFSHRYAYFSLKDPYYYDQRRRARVTLEYLDEGSGAVQLQYDSYDPAATFDGAYTGTPAFHRANTQKVQSRTFLLENARFSNRQNGGSDFRFYVADTPLFIRSVQVEVLDLPAPVLKVAAVDPSPGAVVSAPLPVLTVQFTAGVAPGSVTPQNFRLVRAAGDGEIGNLNDLAVAASQIIVNGNEATFVPAKALPSDLYEVRLVGRGASPIMGLNNRPLDGHFTGSLPSGDGTGGRDFVTRFTLSYVRADFDHDGDVDMSDFGHLQACFTGPYVDPLPGCEDADLNDDQHVDQRDYLRFHQCLGGDQRPVSPGC